MGKDTFWEGENRGHTAVEEQSLPSSVVSCTHATWADGKGQLGSAHVSQQSCSWAQYTPVLHFCLSSDGNAACLHSLGMGTGREGPALSAVPTPST